MKGILGIGFVLVLIASLMVFAVPTQADPYQPLHPALPNMWQGFPPTEGSMGFWFFDPEITQIGPNARAINGDFYTYVEDADDWTGAGATPLNPGNNDIFKSTTDGRTWTVSQVPNYYYNTRTMSAAGPVVDMVCSSLSEDVLYLTDGNYVYRSINGGISFSMVAPEDLETKLEGLCGDPVDGRPITSIDLTYDGAGTPIVFIGTRDVGKTTPAPDNDPIVGSVYWIADQTFSAMWTDLQLRCYGCCATEWPDGDTGEACFDVYAVAAAPGFDVLAKAYAVVSHELTEINFTAVGEVVQIRAGDHGAQFHVNGSGPSATWSYGSTNSSGSTSGSATVNLAANDVMTITSGGSGQMHIDIDITDYTISWRVVTPSLTGPTFCGGTFVVSTLGTVCSWNAVTELRWDCLWSFAIEHSSRIKFPSYYGTDPTLFVGVAAQSKYIDDDSPPYPFTDIDEEGYGEGGDVYRVADTFPPSGCIDLNVQGFMTGCVGLAHANICSLDICNDTLAAGAWDRYQLQSPTRVYYSADGGWTWSPSFKDPTGRGRAWVLFDDCGTIHAATRRCDCGWSMSCGAPLGAFFNQISLINMEIDAVLDLTHAPGYVTESSTMYALTQDESACQQGPLNPEIRSLLRWDGTYWERVHSSRFFYGIGQTWVYDPLYDWVEVSPDFNSTSTLYMANTGFFMTRSIDAGCSWAPLIYPCYDRPCITAWIVVDEDTVLAAGGGDDKGWVWRTINHGSQPWSKFAVTAFPSGYACCGVDFDLSLPRGPDSDVLLGDACGQVFLSQDLGATWVEIADAITGNFGAEATQTYVVFDPGYGTAGDPGENMIYAAAGTKVGRCDLAGYFAGAPHFLQDWVYISGTTALTTCDPFDMVCATGIDAHGDTVLYVSDAGALAGASTRQVTVAGTIGISGCVTANPECSSEDIEVPGGPFTTVTVTETDGYFVNGEMVQVIDWNVVVQRSWVTSGGGGHKGNDVCYIFLPEARFVLRGTESGALGTINLGLTSGYCDPFDGSPNSACWTCFWDDFYACAQTPCTDCEGVGTVIGSFLTASVTGAPATAEQPTGVWRTLNPMDWMAPIDPWDKVEWEFMDYCPAAIPPNPDTCPHAFMHPVADCPLESTGIFPDDLWLTVTANSNVLWALDDDNRGNSPTPLIHIWDDPLARPVIQVQPADGALLATTTTATLEWQPLDNALLYEVMMFSYCELCPENMAEFRDFTTDKTCVVVEGLTPGMTYYWMVRVACDKPLVSKWSTLRSFDTALGAVPYLCSPWCGQDDVILTTNFSWDAVIGATGYELQIVAASADGTADWSGVTTYSSTENAFASIPGLEYSTVYYWRVRSVKDGIYSAWAVCLFTTMDAPAEPVEPPPAVVITQEEITPTWIWVIIGIGGALTIAVVILIVTTRRVP